VSYPTSISQLSSFLMLTRFPVEVTETRASSYSHNTVKIDPRLKPNGFSYRKYQRSKAGIAGAENTISLLLKRVPLDCLRRCLP
jgi:hypothetical protein